MTDPAPSPVPLTVRWLEVGEIIQKGDFCTMSPDDTLDELSATSYLNNTDDLPGGWILTGLAGYRVTIAHSYARRT